MNALLRTRKDTPIAGLVPLKYLLYTAMLSNVTQLPDKEDDCVYAAFKEYTDLYDQFRGFDEDEIEKALCELGDEGLVEYSDDNAYLGEFRGKKFFPFEVQSSLYDKALEVLYKFIKEYGRGKSAKSKSRARYIREQIDKLLDRGIEHIGPGDFTEIHGYLYEIYTGGEIYNIRNKTEYFQTNNMLKAYDKHTTFALIVHGTLRYDDFRKRGVPTLTTVACMKDDVFAAITKTDTSSKDYMRDTESAINNDEF